MPKIVKIAELKHIRDSAGISVSIDGKEIAVFRRNGRLFAVSNVCAHQHFSLLHKGKLEGITVECPMHGWTYDLSTGRAVKGDGMIATFPVFVRGDDVMVELPDE